MNHFKTEEKETFRLAGFKTKSEGSEVEVWIPVNQK